MVEGKDKAAAAPESRLYAIAVRLHSWFVPTVASGRSLTTARCSTTDKDIARGQQQSRSTREKEKDEERIALLDAEPGPSFTYAQGRSNTPALGESSKANYGTIERSQAKEHKKSDADEEEGGWDPEMKKVLVVAGLALLLFPLVMALAWLLPYALDMHFRHAAVVADAPGCAHAGRLMLSKGGSAVDAAVTTMLCQSVVHPHITGLGGGFVMLVYSAKTKAVETLNALPAVPSGFYNSSLQPGKRSKRGAESIAVPGTLHGLWEVHQKYGKLPWKILFDAAFQLSINGFKVSPDLAKNLAKYSEMILADPNLSYIYKNNKTGKVAKAGDTIRNVYLARTLKLASQLGPQVFITDVLGDHLSKDVQAAGGHLTVGDLLNYRPQWQKPLSIDVKVPDKRTVCLHTTPLPTDGFKVALIMRLCEGHFDKSKASKQHLLSALKTTYAVSHLVNNGNMDQVNKTLQQLLSSDRLVGIMKILSDRISSSSDDMLYSADNMDTDLDSDASGFCIRASNGDAVAVASTLNSVFGSGVTSRYTGILLNNQMDKYVLAENGTHGKGSNAIRLKQEVVSVAPTIILSSRGDLELVLSGGGGRYTSADTAYVALNRLILKRHLRSSIAQSRQHVVPFTDLVANERRFPKGETAALKMQNANVSEAFSFRTGVIGVANTTANQYVVSLDRRRSTEFDVI